MDGTGKARNSAVSFQRRQRIAGDAVLSVPDIEIRRSRLREVAQVVGDPDLHHLPRVGTGGRRRHPHRAADRLAEKTFAGDIGGMHHGVMAEAGESVAQFQRMHHAAARIG